MHKTLLLLIALLFPLSLHAQDTESGSVVEEEVQEVTFSGSNLEQKVEMLEELLIDRELIPASVLGEPEQKRETLRQELRRFRERRTELLRTCHRDARRANRTQREDILARCVKNRLAQEQKIVDQKRRYVEGQQGIPEEVRASIANQLQDTSDAIQTIIEAIEADVFTSLDQLKSSLQKLTSQYRAIMTVRLLEMRRHQLRNWVYLLYRHALLLQEIGVREGKDESVEQAADCAWDAWHKLDEIDGQPDLSKQELLQNYQDISQILTTCVNTLRKTIRQERQAKTRVKTESEV